MLTQDNIVFWTIIFVVLITGGLVLCIFFFGKYLFNRERQYRFQLNRLVFGVEDLIRNNNYPAITNAIKALSIYLSDSLERRNEFWVTYGQIVVSIFLVCIITLLLLTHTITAEAGLPLLSAISGFAIAKGAESKKGKDNTPDLPNNNS